MPRGVGSYSRALRALKLRVVDLVELTIPINRGYDLPKSGRAPHVSVRILANGTWNRLSALFYLYFCNINSDKINSSPLVSNNVDG